MATPTTTDPPATNAPPRNSMLVTQQLQESDDYDNKSDTKSVLSKPSKESLVEGKDSVSLADLEAKREPQADDAQNGPNDGEDNDDGMHGPKFVALMTAIVLAGFLILLDTSILVTAIPKITTAFSSLNDVGWYGAAYQLASSSLQPLTGRFYANFNLKWTFVTFLAIFELGSLLCGVATSSNMLIVGRAIAGMGVSGIQNGAFTIIASSVALHRRPTLIGLMQGVGQFGLVSGPLIGGALTQYTTWRWCFYINLPCGGLVLALMAFLDVPENVTKDSPRVVLRDLHNRCDLFGFALFAPACVMFLLAIQWGGTTYPWNSSVIIGLFVGSGVEAIIWLLWDWYKKDDAMVPFSMIKQRNVWASCLNYGGLFSTATCSSYYMPIYFQSARGSSPLISGVHLLPTIIAQLIGAIGGGRLVSKFGYYIPFCLVSAVLMSVGYGLSSTLSVSSGIGLWIGYQIIFAFGRGLGMQMPIIAVQKTATPARMPVAMALTMASATFSSAMFLSFSDTIFNTSLDSLLSGSLPAPLVQKVVASGGAGFRSFLSSSQAMLVAVAYAKSVDRVFYLLIGLAGVCFCSAWGMGWVDIRKKTSKPSAAKESS